MAVLAASALLFTSCDELIDLPGFGDTDDEECVPEFCFDFIYPLDVVIDDDSVSVPDSTSLYALYEDCCEDRDDHSCSSDSTDVDASDSTNVNVHDSTAVDYEDECLLFLFPLQVTNVAGATDTVDVLDQDALDALLEDCN
jgi:hypothetical protein